MCTPASPTLKFQPEMKQIQKIIMTCGLCLGGLLLSVASMQGAVIVTTQQVPTSTTGTGVLAVDNGTGFFTSLTNVSSLDYADASQGNGVTFSPLDSLNGSASAANLNNGAWQSSNSGNLADSFGFQSNVTGRLRVDLQSVIAIAAINSFARHDAERTPQKYTVYGSSASNADSFATTGTQTDLENAGWDFIAGVETGTTSFDGISGANITEDTTGVVGSYQFLLFIVDIPDSAAAGQTTNYGEIDIVAVPEPSALALLAGLGAAGLLFRRRRHD